MKTPEMLLIIGTMLFIQFLNWLIFRKKKEQIKLLEEMIKSLIKTAGNRLISVSKKNEVIGILRAKLDEESKENLDIIESQKIYIQGQDGDINLLQAKLDKERAIKIYLCQTCLNKNCKSKCETMIDCTRYKREPLEIIENSSKIPGAEAARNNE